MIQAEEMSQKSEASYFSLFFSFSHTWIRNEAFGEVKVAITNLPENLPFRATVPILHSNFSTLSVEIIIR